MKIGDKVKVIEGSVILEVWNLVANKAGVIINDNPEDFWDFIVKIENSGRYGDTFGFMADQIRKENQK